MHEELIDIYNENMEIIGASQKKEAHRLGLWHKSIHCWLFSQFNGKYYVIMQKRASCKLLMPDYFDVSVAGHYEKGEHDIDGFREVQEEFGISITKDCWNYLGIKYDVGLSPGAINKEFCEVFFAEVDNRMDEFTICPTEVDAVVWIEVNNGQKLFSGECESITAQGIKWDPNKKKPVKASFELTTAAFIPRTDPYYAKIFAIADLYFRGYKYLYI